MARAIHPQAAAGQLQTVLTVQIVSLFRLNFSNCSRSVVLTVDTVEFLFAGFWPQNLGRMENLGLSRYELRRALRIARNTAILNNLRVDSAAIMAPVVAATAPRKRTLKRAVSVPTRRSRRRRGPANYTGERIDPYGQEEAMERAIMRLVTARGESKTICPSEAARVVAKELSHGDWRSLMPLARSAGARLRSQGKLLATQKGEEVEDVLGAVGPIRFKVVPNYAPAPKALRIGAAPRRKVADVAESALSSAEWLRENSARVLAALATEERGHVPTSEGAWRALAVRRWGGAVSLGPGSGADVKAEEDGTFAGWRGFVLSRIALPVGPSERASSLLQEEYAGDPWRLLAACNLMSRVSSHTTKVRCLTAFFARFPTPSELLALGAEDSAERGASVVRPLIASLGLFANRFSALLDIAEAICSRPLFVVDLKGGKIRGIGQFGYESFRIWIRREGASMRPGDRNLETYCAELRRLRSQALGQGSDTATATTEGDA